MAKRIQVGGRIESEEVGGIVTGAAEILDDAKGKKQSVINQETDDELVRLEQSKQDNLTFDNAPTEGSDNPVKSGGVYAADKALSDAIEAILLLIPSAASALNKLVDTSMMNSSISTATATFRGTYNVVTDLSLTVDATHEQIAAALGNAISTADNNDYAFVQIPVSAESTDIRRTERYKFNGTVWGYEYDLNTSGFTAAQWAAINSGITLALVSKLIGLPTSSELQALLGQKQDTLTFDNVPTAGSANPVKSGGVHTAINDEKTAREQLANTVTGIEGRVGNVEEVIPTGAAANNKLVANNSMEAYVTSIIEAITASFTIATADGHINLTLTQTNGRVASLTLTSSDIASAQALTALTGRVTTAEENITTLGGRVSTNETDIANLQQLYNDLQQSRPVPVTALPETGQQQGVIYRLAGTTSYSDYMWNGSMWVLMATYDNAIDDVPTAESNNLVKSGGVWAQINPIDKKVNGWADEYDFSHEAVGNGVFPFVLPKGSYTLTSNHTSFYSGLTIYLRDSEDNLIVSGNIITFITGGVNVSEDVAKIQLYGTVANPGILQLKFTSTDYHKGLEEKVDEIGADYISKSVFPIEKNILFEQGQIIVTGTGSYVNKVLLVLEGDEIDKQALYYFEADSFSNSQDAAPFYIYATINGVESSVGVGGNTPKDALVYYTINGADVTKLRFVLYPKNSGAVFNGVRIYKKVDYVPCNVIDGATSIVLKEALSRNIPSLTCKTVAHRGWCSTAPQCMLSAVLEAKKNLATIVENDVFNSKDEELVMWHDTTLRLLGEIQDVNGFKLYLDPTLLGELTEEYGDELYYDITSPLYWYDENNELLYTWNGSDYQQSSVSLATLIRPDVTHLSVKSFNLSDLKRFDFGSWKNVKYKAETIPTFEEWVSYCKCLGVGIYIDKKISEELVTDKIEEMVAIVRRYGMLRNATWLGFWPAVRTYDPKARCILLATPTEELVNNQAIKQALADGGENSFVFETEISNLTYENARLALDNGFGLEAYYVGFFPYSTSKNTIFNTMIDAMKKGCQALTMDFFTVEDAIYENYIK